MTSHILQISLIAITASFWSPMPEVKHEKDLYRLTYDEWKAEIQQLSEIPLQMSSEEKAHKKNEINAQYMTRFLRLAQENPNSDLWIDCLIWTTAEGSPSADYDAMFDLLGERAETAQNLSQLQLLMSQLILMNSDRINPALTTISENHHNHGLRGAALYSLAVRTKNNGEAKGDTTELALAETLLEKVIAEYPEVITYNGKNLKNATGLLEELRSPLAIGKVAPETRGKLMSGEAFDLHQAIKGKVAIVSFSGHWCPPCVAMHPVQKEIITRFPADKVTIVEINSDALDSLDRVQQKLAKEGLDWTVVTDGSTGPISQEWQISSWPTYLLIDTNGQIRRKASGNIGPRLIEWVDEFVSNDESPSTPD